MPDEPEALGLLALMLFHDARSAARVDGAGDLVVLEEQDRSLWDAAAIAEGAALLDAAAAPGAGPGPFQVQAAIAACHVAATAARRTGREIAALYATCSPWRPSAVDRAEPRRRRLHVRGARGGPGPRRRASPPDGELRGYHLLPAARADMLRRLGRRAEAAAAYRRARDLAGTDAERRYLERRLREATVRPASV